MTRAAQALGPADLKVGMRAEFETTVDERAVLDYARISGDHNPLHVDAVYAATTLFERRIVHGAYQIGLASAMVGMHLPGQRALLGSMHARFPSPLYFPSTVKVVGEVTAWDADHMSGASRVHVIELSRGVPTAEITVAFAMHGLPGGRKAAADSRPAGGAKRSDNAQGRRIVLVTGASGGIGVHLVRDLCTDHHVLALTNRTSLPPEFASMPQVQIVRADLADPAFADVLGAALAGRKLYGVVHAAWPGAPRGGLLQVAEETLDQQLQFGTKFLIRIANALASHVSPEGGRLVAIGTTAATNKPKISMSAYSLGKAAMEHTVRLLAPELARKRITINAINPSLVAEGINKTISDRAQLKEAALVPMSRLCQPADVLAGVRYLLGDGSAYFSGQLVQLTGAQL